MADQAAYEHLERIENVKWFSLSGNVYFNDASLNCTRAEVALCWTYVHLPRIVTSQPALATKQLIRARKSPP